MTPRDWIGFASLLLAFVGGLAGLIKWLVSGWMRSMEASDRQIAQEVDKMADELRHYEQVRHECQSRHDRELSELRVELRSSYVKREELNGLISRLEVKLDSMNEKLDTLKERVLEGNRE